MRLFKNLFRRSTRAKFLPAGRSLRYETMEGRLVLSASGFAGNECPPELNDGTLDTIVLSQPFAAQTEIAFEFRAADVVIDEGAGATPVDEIRFTLDPDIGSRTNGATPAGATLVFNDQGTTDEADDRWEFSWTPDGTQVGNFRLYMIATDDGGTAGVPLSDVYAFDLEIENKPSVDLNGADDSGIDFGPVAFTEADDSMPVSIVDSDLSIPVAPSGMIASATVQIVDPQADGLETLGITAGSSLVVDSSTPGRLVITVDGGGLANKSVFEEALRTLTYHNTSDAPAAVRTITVVVNDGNSDSDAATATVNITATNDEPDLQEGDALPAALVGQEYVLSLVASDPDAAEQLVFRLISGPAGATISPLQTGGSDTTAPISADQDGLFRAEIRWTPTEEQHDGGPFEFLVSVTDSGGLADTEVFTVVIENQDPVAVDDSEYTTDEDTTLTVGTRAAGLLGNDTDDGGNAGLVVAEVNGDANNLTGPVIISDSEGRMGQLTVQTDGTFTFVPGNLFDNLASDESTEVTFTYRTSDGEVGSALSNEATATITVAGENDAPMFDLNETDGLASTLPKGSLLAADQIAVQLDLSSDDPNVNSLNMNDILGFTSDIDSDKFRLSLVDGDNGGTAFRTENLPTLNGFSELIWVPTTEDLGEGYVIRVQAKDQPLVGDALTTTFDIVVSVIASPQVVSVSGLDVSQNDKEIVLLFSKAMGTTALEASNYDLDTADGTLPIGTSVPLAAVTANGSDGVILQISDTTTTTLLDFSVTKLKLTLNSAIDDTDGHGLTGNLEFDVDLLSPQEA